MKNKTLANWLIVSFTLGVLNSLVFGDLESMYTIAGLGMIVFGIWAIVRLYKLEDSK